MSVRELDPMNVNAISDGHVTTGFADGTFIQMEQDEESFTTMVGAKGEVSRTKNANKMGTFTVTLSQTSPSNAHYARLARTGKIHPFYVIDQNDGSRSGGRECWVEQQASKEWAKEEQSREWTIKVAELEVDE